MIPISLPKVVLVVDDDEDTRNIVSSAVSLQRYTPIEAVDGEHALALCRETTPDLVILDVMMPKKDGIEVCQELRQEDEDSHLPILMLTARDDVKDKVRALDAGADDYLTKPFDLNELTARMNALLRVRELNLQLIDRNTQLAEMQETIVDQERQLLANQLAGATAHNLGQPIAAIMLNCHLLENMPPDDEKFKIAVESIVRDSRRMKEMLEKLQKVDPTKVKEYFRDMGILDLEE